MLGKEGNFVMLCCTSLMSCCVAVGIYDLKVATEVASRQAKIDAENRERNDRAVSQLSNDRANIKTQIEKLSK